MTPKGLKVVHVLPDRIRLKADKVKGNPPFARQIEARLAKVPGIKQVEAKPDTGSILIYFSLGELLAHGALPALRDGFSELFPEIEAEALALGFESLAEQLANTSPNPTSGGVLHSLAAVNTQVSRLTGGLDLKLLVPLTFLFFGVRSLFKTEKVPFPAWYDYFWFAFSSFMMLNRGMVEGREESGSRSQPGQGGLTTAG